MPTKYPSSQLQRTATFGSDPPYLLATSYRVSVAEQCRLVLPTSLAPHLRRTLARSLLSPREWNEDLLVFHFSDRCRDEHLLIFHSSFRCSRGHILGVKLSSFSSCPSLDDVNCFDLSFHRPRSHMDNVRLKFDRRLNGVHDLITVGDRPSGNVDCVCLKRGRRFSHLVNDLRRTGWLWL